MKKKVIAVVGTIVLLVCILLSACSAVKDEKILVAYFSATGNTRAVASQLAHETGADLFEITPKDPYTEVQLGYDDPDQRISKEQADENCRVEIAGTVENFEQYDTVYIGYPIWYGKVPRIVLTFLESYDFEGKKIIPFCTSDNDGIETGLEEIQKDSPKAEWLEGQRFDSAVIDKALDQNGSLTDSGVKEAIAAFAQKNTPKSNKNAFLRSKATETGSDSAETTKEVTFEEGSNTSMSATDAAISETGTTASTTGTSSDSSTTSDVTTANTTSIANQTETDTSVTTETASTDATTENVTSATLATELPESTSTTNPSETTPQSTTAATPTTERVTETTTLGDNDTPFIPIP